jgi:hypothetical protein
MDATSSANGEQAATPGSAELQAQLALFQQQQQQYLQQLVRVCLSVCLSVCIYALLDARRTLTMP